MAEDFPRDITAQFSVTLPAAPHRPTRRTQHFRRIAVGLLVVAGCVNYLDRAAVAIGNPNIRADLGLSYAQMGLLLSAFAWAYGLAQIPAGALVDRLGPRRALGGSLVVWSMAQLGAALVGSLPQFLVARVALGLGESPLYIGGTRVCADWYPRRARALPIAIFNASSALAPAIAPPLLTALMLAYGWRAMFAIAGLSGFVVAALWAALYRTPGPALLAAEDLAEISREDTHAHGLTGLAQLVWLLRFRTAWGMFLGFFGVVYVSWLYATWLPGYLETARHLSIASAGAWASVPLGAGFFGAVAGGFISSRLGLIGLDAAASCRLPIIVGLVVAGVATFAAPFVASTHLAIALMAIGLCAANIASSCGWALAAVITPANTIATLEAVQNVGGSLGGALAPLITGIAVQRSGSFTFGFALAGVIALASAAAYLGLTRREIVAPDRG